MILKNHKAAYLYEHDTWNSLGESTYEFNSPELDGKPVWAYILGNGLRDSSCPVPEPFEVRVVVYTAVTMDVKGIIFYGYKIWGAGSQNTGLSNNPSLHRYFKQLGQELISLNDILVLPTQDYSWHYRTGSQVTFMPDLDRYVLWQDRKNFNYILKQDGAKTYLVVVNKDSRAISDVVITISGLAGAGSMTAQTLGLETDSTGRAGRVLSVKDGQFTDSFDGYAVHVYEIAP